MEFGQEQLAISNLAFELRNGETRLILDGDAEIRGPLRQAGFSLDFDLGKSDLRGDISISVSDSGEKPLGRVDLISRAVDIRQLAPKHADRLRTGPSTVIVEEKDEDRAPEFDESTGEDFRRVLEETAVSLDWLNRIEGELRYRIDKVVDGPELIGNFFIDSRIENGLLTLDRLELRNREEFIEIKGSVDALVHPSFYEFEGRIENAPVGFLLGLEADD